MVKMKMNVYMNRLLLIVSVLVLAVTFLFGMSIKANAATTADTATASSSDKVYVIDTAEKLTDSERERLEELCKKKSDNCKIDFVVMITNTGLDYTPLDNYVRDILEKQYGYNGTGTDCDAACYVIDMKSRADRIITSGRARHESNFDQNKLDKVRERAEKRLKDGDYYGGCVKYLQGMEEHLNKNILYRCTLHWPIKLLIAAVVAVVSVIIMMAHAKSKMTVSGNTYARGHHGNVVGQQDLFINTTVVTHQIQSNSGGGGGGGGGNSGSSGGHF